MKTPFSRFGRNNDDKHTLTAMNFQTPFSWQWWNRIEHLCHHPLLAILAFAESTVYEENISYEFLFQFLVEVMMRIGKDLTRNEAHIWNCTLFSTSRDTTTESSLMMRCFIGSSWS